MLAKLTQVFAKKVFPNLNTVCALGSGLAVNCKSLIMMSSDQDVLCMPRFKGFVLRMEQGWRANDADSRDAKTVPLKEEYVCSFEGCGNNFKKGGM